MSVFIRWNCGEHFRKKLLTINELDMGYTSERMDKGYLIGETTREERERNST